MQLQREIMQLRATTHNGNQIGDNEDFARMFPPTMISKMASQTITSEKLLEEADWAKVSRKTMHQGPLLHDPIRATAASQGWGFRSFFCAPAWCNSGGDASLCSTSSSSPM